MRAKIVALFSLFCVLAVMAAAQQYPKPTGYVNDFAGVLSHDEGEALNNELIAFEKKTSKEIAVVTVSSLQGQDVADYTRGLAKEWGVGKKGLNNGVVFLMAPNERKLWIVPGSGVQSILTDDRANDIYSNDVRPLFREGKRAESVIAGAHAIMRVLEENVSASQPSNGTNGAGQSTGFDDKAFVWGLVILCAAVLIVIIGGAFFERLSARAYVLDHRKSVEERMEKIAEDLAKNPDVKKETRLRFKGQQDALASISSLQEQDDNVEWVSIRNQLDAIDLEIRSIQAAVNNEIAFADEARTKGPQLMEALPARFAEIEQKIAAGKQSETAVQRLAQARAYYDSAREQQSGMTTTDWILLYVLLNNSSSSCDAAISAHSSANYSYRSSSLSSFGSSTESSSGSGSGFGFGSTSGFGDGGGFSGGGGGDL